MDQWILDSGIPLHGIEKALFQKEEMGETGSFDETCYRKAVEIRRRLLGIGPGIPWTPDMDYSQVYRRCGENIIGYIPVPLGCIINAKIDGKIYTIPIATTEGALVASTQRGFKAVFKDGIRTHVVDEGMTRAPVVTFPQVEDSIRLKEWLSETENFLAVKMAFDSSSSHINLQTIKVALCGCDAYLRFKARTGDAMGMNMVGKACEHALRYIAAQFPLMRVISLSGNYCTDKKPAAINWIDGRGKSVIASATIPESTIKEIFRVSGSDLLYTNMKKNLKGSILAGVNGAAGINAHAANIVTGIFIATGQDPAQAVVSSACFMELELVDDGHVRICCTMPCLEVGTIGGGTHLLPQKTALDILGIAGSTSPSLPSGENARTLARVICASVLAAELSLLASLTEGSLMEAHLTLNRASVNLIHN